MSGYTKVTKHRRLGKILSIVDRWGPIPPAEIIQKLSIAYTIPVKDLKRNVQNDLKFLRDEGELVQNYYDKFGNFMGDELDIDENDTRFKTTKWQTVENKLNLIPGLSELKKYKADLITLPQYQNILSIKQGKKKIDFANFAFYFELGHELYHLEINLSTFPNTIDALFQLLVVRAADSALAIQLLKQEMRPTAILVLNDPYLSALTSPLGPFILCLHKSAHVHIADLGSKNPIIHYTLEAHEEDELLSRLTFHNNQTKTQHWSELKENDQKSYKEGSQQNISLPCMIRVKDYSGFILS